MPFHFYVGRSRHARRPHRPGRARRLHRVCGIRHDGIRRRHGRRAHSGAVHALVRRRAAGCAVRPGLHGAGRRPELAAGVARGTGAVVSVDAAGHLPGRDAAAQCRRALAADRAGLLRADGLRARPEGRAGRQPGTAAHALGAAVRRVRWRVQRAVRHGRADLHHLPVAPHRRAGRVPRHDFGRHPGQRRRPRRGLRRCRAVYAAGHAEERCLAAARGAGRAVRRIAPQDAGGAGPLAAVHLPAAGGGWRGAIYRGWMSPA